MKRFYIYIVAIIMTLTLTGCFSNANVAKSDLHHVKTEANSTVEQNNKAKSAANSELKAISNENYKDLTTPKW